MPVESVRGEHLTGKQFGKIVVRRQRREQRIASLLVSGLGRQFPFGIRMRCLLQ